MERADTFCRLLQQVIPNEDTDSENVSVDKRSSEYVRRPAFSLPLMTNNFRRFNGRIGIVFVFQNRLIRLFTWRVPSHTLSFLAVYSFVCLDPYLLVIVPIAAVLLFIMVPAFLTRHPPPPSTSASLTTQYYSINGPALAPPKTIKPASETSKDFFHNMRDLQNCMADFTNLHDALVAVVAPATNFSNEVFSSALFVYLSGLTVFLFLAAHLIPWRHIFLAGGASLVCAGHPKVQRTLLKIKRRAQEKAAALDAEARKDPELAHKTIFGLPVPRTPSSFKSAVSGLSAITLDTAPQIREVEIFEIQHRHSEWDLRGDWEAHLFSPTPFDPLSPMRISGERVRGTRFFEDVNPPNGWVWESKKWELDLEAKEWVTERLITGVEFEVPLEGEVVSTEYGGWVWDLPRSESEEGAKDTQKRGKGGSARKESRSDWEERTTTGIGQRGDWRRRRWVRMVKRIADGVGAEVGPRSPKSKRS